MKMEGYVYIYIYIYTHTHTQSIYHPLIATCKSFVYVYVFKSRG